MKYSFIFRSHREPTQRSEGAQCGSGAAGLRPQWGEYGAKFRSDSGGIFYFGAFCLDSDNQSCVTDQDRDKNKRPLILDSGDNCAKTSRPGRQRVPPETCSHSEMPI